MTDDAGVSRPSACVEHSVGISDVLASTKRPLGVVPREAEEWWAGLANAVKVMPPLSTHFPVSSVQPN